MPPSQRCSLQAPAASRAGLALRPDGQFLVADNGNNRVQLCPGGGASCTTAAGGNGAGCSATQFNHPFGDAAATQGEGGPPPVLGQRLNFGGNLEN